MWIYWISLMDINGYQWIRMDIQDGYLIQYNKSDMFRLRPVYIHEYPYISIHIHRYPTYPQGPSSQMRLLLRILKNISVKIWLICIHRWSLGQYAEVQSGWILATWTCTPKKDVIGSSQVMSKPPLRSKALMNCLLRSSLVEVPSWHWKIKHAWFIPC